MVACIFGEASPERSARTMRSQTMDGFTRGEGEAKIGKRVKAKVAFRDVPRGTRGLVVYIDEAINETREGYDVCVQWEFPGRKGTPVKDWFSKLAYRRQLAELRS
jgi:hypothetical protein